MMKATRLRAVLSGLNPPVAFSRTLSGGCGCIVDVFFGLCGLFV